MKISDLPEDCVACILDFLPDLDVWRYGETIPNAAIAVDAHWKRKHRLNVWNISDEDADNILSIIAKCKNLETLSIANELCKIKQFEKIPSVLKRHCRKIKHLYLPGFILDEKSKDHLSHLSSLKTLHMTLIYRSHRPSRVLEIVNGPCLAILSNTLQNLKIHLNIPNDEHTNILIRSFLAFRLEHLDLSGSVLSQANISGLSHVCGTLKSLKLCILLHDNSLRDLVRINRRLESLSLFGIKDETWDDGFRIYRGERFERLENCFNFFPRTIKSIHITGRYIIQCQVFLECMSNWNLESLKLPYNIVKNDPFLFNFGERAPELQELFIGVRAAPCVVSNSLEKMTKLRHLGLDYVGRTDVEVSKAIINSPVALNILSISKMSFVPAIFEDIGLLPSLDTLNLKDMVHDNIPFFNECVQNLSRSQTLTSVKIENGRIFDNDDAVLIIHSCKHLNRLEIVECSSVTVDLIQKTVKILDTQKNRKTIFTLIINQSNILQKDVPRIYFHRLLDVKIIQHDAPHPLSYM